MKKIILSLPPITIVHPNDPEVTVTMDRPSPEDENEYRRTLATYQKFVAVVHPETHEIVRNAAHEPVMVALPVVYPANVMFEYFERRIRDVTGCETQDGRPMAWNQPNKRTILRGFLHDSFNVKEEREEPELDEAGNPTGVVVKKPVQIGWFNYLTERLHSSEDAADPLAVDAEPSSKNSATSDSA